MKVFHAAAVVALLAAPAYAQTPSIPKYGEVDKDKTPHQKEAERDAERAYQRSLGNIPEKGAADPWGNVRSDSTPKTATKSAPEKRARTGHAAN
ncbi:MAG: hypothetical protein QOF07_1554 [Bradyrhizobium sp.]|jgi:hypothetical protein|nr:hypothetical protein [Bradyrhizobium sp.]